MANTKLTTEELLIKEKVNNYLINVDELSKLQARYEKFKDSDSNSIAQYGNRTASSGMPSSKIENIVIQKSIIEEQIKKISEEIEQINYATDKLFGLQKQVVLELMAGIKIADICKKFDIKRKKIDLLRKRAFSNMYAFICEYKNTK